MLFRRCLKRHGTNPPGRRDRRSAPSAGRRPIRRLIPAFGCLAAILAWGAAASLAQIAPGPLSPAHAQQGGITGCASCHDFGARRLKCLECHTEINRRVEAGTGFHSRAYRSSAEGTDCARCHKEHRGRGAALVPLDRKSFDHGAQTGFVLEGKHRQQRCENCHNAGKIAPAARSEIKLKDLNRSFLGLRRDCAACHQEPHQNQVGSDCKRCHTPAAWKPAAGFDHSRAAFPLTGRHLQVACQKCHASLSAAPGAGAPANGSASGATAPKLVLFKGKAFDGCQNCHADQHRGAFLEVKMSGKCADCHNTSGWKNDRPGRDFNHSATKFRLVGKHAELSCSKCHKESNFKNPIAHELCRDCHEDPHKGQFAARAAGSDCASCHAPANFKPPLFDRVTHMSSAFPLAGKHNSLSCSKCHQPEGRDARYKTGKLACNECHADPHGGEFAAEPNGNRCNLCHTEKGFEVTTFTLERHAQTQFPLTGRHTGIECVKCHKPLAPAPALAAQEGPTPSQASPPLVTAGGSAAQNARRQFHFASRGCGTCHADPHRLSPKAGLACESCHATQQWQSVRPFDHSSTRFKLEGPHLDAARQSTGCAKCHKPAGQPDGSGAKAAPVFSGTPTLCSGCHREKDAHGGQFSGPGRAPEDCLTCHAPGAWNGASFSHDRTRFPLSAVHRKTECARCHKEQKEVNGKMVRVYRDTPADCVKCH